MSVAAALYNYMLTCPLLSNSDVNADYLGNNVGQFSVDCIPGDTVLRSYPDGSSVRVLQFAVSSRESYGPHTLQNLQNIGFFEQLSDWLETASQQNRLPELGENKTALSITPVSTVYILEEGADNARYQIQCRLKYLQTV